MHYPVGRFVPIETLPDHRTRRVVVGTTVRKPLVVLQAYLATLDWQERPKQTHFDYCFVPDFTPDQQDAYQYLLKWVNERGGTLIQAVPSTTEDFSDAAHHDSHQWSSTAMARVGHQKNLIIQYALESKADALWFVDADLLLDRTTFLSLNSCDKPIVTGVYWTHWSKRSTETSPAIAMPQVWLRHPYELSGRGMDDAEFRQKLLSRTLTRVWGFGANTLIARRVLEAGVNFDYLPDVPREGLMGGEDRHFCIRTERLHIDAYADPWPEQFHIYHAEGDIPRIPEMLKRLGAEHPKKARLGDLVSLRLRPLEPLPVAPGQFQQPQPVLLRGRLGQLALMPEIEEAVYGLIRGERCVVKCHFPIHYPAPFLRGRTRLIEVTLLDCKSFGFPPIVENELHVGQNSGAWHDRLTLVPNQLASIAEDLPDAS